MRKELICYRRIKLNQNSHNLEKSMEITRQIYVKQKKMNIKIIEFAYVINDRKCEEIQKFLNKN